MSYSIVISDISVTREEDDIYNELTEKYDGVIDVRRWYFDDDENFPMSCVQVHFDSQENMNKVSSNGHIFIGGLCRQISIVKESQCYRCQKFGHKVKTCTREPLNEKDLINLCAEQKQRLTQVINNIEMKLNEITVRH